jgi:hypothetical protein
MYGHNRNHIPEDERMVANAVASNAINFPNI